MLDWLRELRWRIEGWLETRGRHRPPAPARAADPVQSTLEQLCAAADEKGIDALTARQQLVVRTWSARGIVGNGGFRYFLEGSAPLQPVANGFRELGFPAAADACERVLATVVAQPGLTEAARREIARKALPEDVLLSESPAVYRISWEDLEAASGAFMRRNPRDFPGVPPA
jgi:hypothetical protein